MIFIAHLAFSAACAAAFESEAAVAQAVAFVVAGWILLLGLLVVLAALMRMTIDVRTIVRMTGWVAIPIVLRTLGGFLSVWAPLLEPLRSHDLAQLSLPALWLRPLDIFEMSAALILGISLRRQPGGSAAKSILVTLTVALAWNFATHGYLQPLLNASAREQKVETPILPNPPAPVVEVPPPSASPVFTPAEPPALQKKIQAMEVERKEIREERRLQELRLPSAESPQPKATAKRKDQTTNAARM